MNPGAHEHRPHVAPAYHSDLCPDVSPTGGGPAIIEDAETLERGWAAIPFEVVGLQAVGR
jgi:hypothetical protein